MSSSCLVFKFHGHACVSAHYKDLIIVIDPHDGASLGLSPPSVKGDLILVTHDHFDHNAVNVVSKPDSVVLESFVGEKRLLIKNVDVNILGVRVPHDKQSGKRRGWVSAYRVSIGDFAFVHLGDIGDYPSEEALMKLSQPKPDVLFIPVGGFYTVEPYEAWDIAIRINPSFIVPIHYWVKGLNLPIKPVNDFLLAAKTGKEEKEVFEICAKEVPEKPRIILLKPT